MLLYGIYSYVADYRSDISWGIKALNPLSMGIFEEYEGLAKNSTVEAGTEDDNNNDFDKF